MEYFWVEQVYDMVQAAEYSAGILDAGLLVRCDCLRLMCMFLREPQRNLFQNIPTSHLAQSTVKNVLLALRFLG